MGKKKSQPSPPTIKYPKMSAQERKLLNQQIQLADQLIGQSKTTFDQGQADRELAFEYLGRLDGPFSLDPFQEDLANRMSQNFYDMAFSNLTSGQNQEIFDQARRDSIAGLVSSGLTNSTTGVEVLTALEKEKQRQIAQLAQETSAQNLGLQNQFLNQQLQRDFGAFQTLYGGGAQGAQVAGNLAAQGGSSAQSAQNVLATERLNKFQVDTQNLQAKYLHDLNQSRRNNSGLFGNVGSLVGAGAALAAAPFTGGASLSYIPMAGAFGGMAGSTVGSFI